jgi:hypothetical protein
MKSVETAGAAFPAPRLIPLTDWNKHHEWPPQGGLRHLMFHRETNGFARAFVKCGRRVLVDEAEFFSVVKQGGGHGAAAA